jgi:hypothetical protein
MPKDEGRMPNNDQRPTVNDQRRIIIGILTVIFFLGALGFSIWPPSGSAGQEWQSACWRIGPLLAVFWLAYNDLKRIPRWLWFMLPVIFIVMVKWPKTLLLLIPFLILLALLKLRLKSR